MNTINRNTPTQDTANIGSSDSNFERNTDLSHTTIDINAVIFTAKIKNRSLPFRIKMLFSAISYTAIALIAVSSYLIARVYVPNSQLNDVNGSVIILIIISLPALALSILAAWLNRSHIKK